MEKITRFAVDYPVTILMMVCAVLLLGYISFQKLGMDLFPELNNPRLFVELKAGERPPEEIEKQFVTSLESQAIRLKNVIQVSSVSRVGSAEITVEYSWEANMGEAFLDLQKALASFNQNTDIDELVITQHDPNAAPMVMLAFSHPNITDMDELRRVADNYLKNEIIRLEGVADVKLLGQEEKEILIETNDYIMEAYGITPSSIGNSIRSYNQNISGGSIVEMGRKYIIRGIGEFESLDDIAHVIVAQKQRGSEGEQVTQTSAQSQEGDLVPVFLKDVAEIHAVNKKPENIVRVNGVRCIGIAIYKETKYNTIKAVKELEDALKKISRSLPGYELKTIKNQAQFITVAINELKDSAVIGILLAVLVLYFFLQRIGTTLIISIAIPISIIATFTLMYFNHLTVNIMTLGGLALGAGMLVDNAIVVVENSFRHLENGLTPRDSSIRGTAQVAGAITSSTLTTIVIFLPIVYLHGTSGELFKDQAWTVAISLLSSLAVAILVIPMLTSRFLRVKETDFGGSIRFPWYRAFLGRLLDYWWVVILGAVLLMALAFSLIPKIGSEFIPKTDVNRYSVNLKLAEGTELFRTSGAVENIEKTIREIFGNSLATVYSVSGPSTDTSTSSMYQGENTATIELEFARKSNLTPDMVHERITKALADVPDIEYQISQEETVTELTMGSEAAPVVIEIEGEDLDVLKKLTEETRTRISQVSALYNIETSFDEGRPEVDIVLDRINAGMYNIGIDSFSSQIRERLQGTDAGQWENEGELKDITIKLPDVGVNKIETISFKTGDQNVNFSDLATIRVSQTPNEIYRRNQVRIGKVSADLKGEKPLDHVVREIREKMSGISFPEGYRYTIGGEEQKRSEAFQSLKFALILSIILVYMVLASQFESLIHPFTILLTIPLAGAGTVLLFYLTGNSFNIMAYIGIILLAGIAVNNAIIFIDAINQLKREGFSRREAILEAGMRRIRPILMTSLTTILGLMPLTFGFGEGAALRAPMALAVVGGLFTSTLLTLVVIPCVYLVLDSIGGRE